jgi:hypothetical protein
VVLYLPLPMYEGAAEGRLRTKIHSIVIVAIDAKGCPSLGRKRGDARFRPSALSHRQTVNTVIPRWACCRAQKKKTSLYGPCHPNQLLAGDHLGHRYPATLADTSLCQTVSLSSWLQSGHRKMRISEPPPSIGTIELRCISTLQRQSGNSVEPAASTRSNFDMTRVGVSLP